MTPDERTALIALWDRVPETRPERFVYGLDGNSWIAALKNHDGTLTVLTDTEASALACDSIERWILSKSGAMLVLNGTAESWMFKLSICDSLGPRWGMITPMEAPYATKLSALLAAANAVADRSKT